MAATIRKWHRWISIAFTVAVIAIFAMQAIMVPPEWAYYLPLPFLFALILSGLYMLVRHYRSPLRP